jgi:mannose-6-phosphate isomerase class I
MIKLSAAGRIEHPLYVVAATNPGEAIKALEDAHVLNGCVPKDIGPISARLIERLGLRPGQFVQVNARKPRGGVKGSTL